MPRVSVILPVRDGRYLGDAVDSILSQDFTDLELVVVDDHGRDGSVARLPREDARLRIVQNPGDGLIDALNAGLDAARGTFIARMDADDIALPHRLGCQLAYLARHPAIDIAGGRVELFAEPAPGVAPGTAPATGADQRNGDPSAGAGNRRYQDWVNGLTAPGEIRRELFVESPLPHPTWFARREVFERLGGYRDAGWPEDYDLLLRADAAGLRFGKPAQPMLRWRDHASRLSRTDDRYALERFTAAKAHFLAACRLRGLPAVIWGAGPGGAALHDALAHEGAEVRGFLEVHPRRIGGAKRGLPVWHFEEAAVRAQDAFVLVAVGVPSARPEIRRYLESAGRREGDDWLFAA